jgi:hypothetical protein
MEAMAQGEMASMPVRGGAAGCPPEASSVGTPVLAFFGSHIRRNTGPAVIPATLPPAGQGAHRAEFGLPEGQGMTTAAACEPLVVDFL